MKYLLILLLIASNVNGQQTLKNGCNKMFIDGKEKLFIDSVLSYIDGYYFVKDTSLYGTDYKISIYTNNELDELQFWFNKIIVGEDFNKKESGTPMLEFDKIIGQYLTVEKIYLNYYGRVVDMKVVSHNENDTWKPFCNDFQVWIKFRPIQRKGYWEINL